MRQGRVEEGSVEKSIRQIVPGVRRVRVLGEALHQLLQTAGRFPMTIDLQRRQTVQKEKIGGVERIRKRLQACLRGHSGAGEVVLSGARVGNEEIGFLADRVRPFPPGPFFLEIQLHQFLAGGDGSAVLFLTIGDLGQGQGVLGLFQRRCGSLGQLSVDRHRLFPLSQGCVRRGQQAQGRPGDLSIRPFAIEERDRIAVVLQFEGSYATSVQSPFFQVRTGSGDRLLEIP